MWYEIVAAFLMSTAPIWALSFYHVYRKWNHEDLKTAKKQGA